jgi:AraC-like DNA-binding protein
MRFLLDPPGQGQVLVQDWVPPDLEKWILPFSRISYTAGLFGRILSQEISLQEYTLWYHRFWIDRPVMIHPLTDEGMLTLHYMMQGSVECNLKGFGKIKLKKGGYQLYGLPARLSHDAWFEPGEYISFHLGFSKETIIQLALQYKLFNGLVKTLKDHGAGISIKSLFRIRPKINRAIEDILACRDEKMKRILYLDERISILINAWLEDLEAYERNLLWAESRVLKLQELENFIRANLGAHPDVLSLDNLARICGMSKKQFHETYSMIYQLPIDDFILSLRMKRAVELLAEGGHAIGEISEMLGYADRANFSRAFRKYYGKTPGSWRGE